MSTPHVTLLLAEYMDGELQTGAAERVRSHLIFCNPCRSMLQEYQDNARSLKELRQPAAPPANLATAAFEAVEINVEAPPAEKPKRGEREQDRSPQQARLPQGKIAAAAGVAGLIIWLLFRAGNNPSAPVERAATPRASTETSTTTVATTPLVTAVAPVTPPTTLAASIPTPPVATPPVPREKKPVTTATPVAAPATLVPAKPAPAATLPSENEPKNQSNFKDLQAINGGIEAPLEVVLSDQKGWNRVWGRFQKNQAEKSSPPQVDFATSEVIAIAGGAQATAGCTVEFQRILTTTWEGKPARVVNYRVNTPQNTGTLGAAVITYPASFKVVPKFDGPTFFRKNS